MKQPLSAYQPSKDVIDITIEIKKDYEEGVRIIDKPWTELNDRSVINDMNRGQMMLNAFVDTSVEDKNEAWKWRGTRSMARNKAIAMHANLTAAYLLPLFVAQNDNDEVDRDLSEVMRDIIEWMAQPINSDYQSSFLQVVFGMISDPVVFLGAEFCEVYQTIKEKTDKGIDKKKVLDEVLSGFKCPIWSANQILITNAYERNIQKQRSIIKRRYCEYEELEAKYGDHPNWSYVQKGIRSVYSDEDGLFYDIKDQDHPNLVAEEIWYHRRKDMEITLINGIYMGDDVVSHNPIKHRDNKGNPKYNVVPFVYFRIGNHFFYGKSLMNSLGWDNMLYDAMSEVVMNKALLEVSTPIAITGTDKVDSEVIFPNSVVALEDKDSRITPLLPQSNIVAGFNALNSTKESITEGSVSETMSGQLPEASQKAFTVQQAQQQAKKMIGAVGKNLAESIIQYGSLMKDIAINYITVPQIDELVSGRLKMKYKTFVLNKEKSGKETEDIIKFDDSLIGAEMTEEEEKVKGYKLLEEIGYPKTKKSIRLINPEMFAKFNYFCKVDIEEMFVKGQEYWQPVLSNLYAQLANNPLIDQAGLLRKLLYSYFRGEGEDMIKEEQQQVPGLPVPQTPMVNQVMQKQSSLATQESL